MKNKKIVIAGGTGFIGQSLAAFFGKDNDIVILSRSVPAAGPDHAGPNGTNRRADNLTNGSNRRSDNLTNGTNLPTGTRNLSTANNNYGAELITNNEGYRIRYVYWDGLRVERSWASEIDGCDLVINLAGKSVNCRYTEKNRQEIFDSRTDSTRAIGLAIRDAVTPPKVWINAASATIYRAAVDRPQDEYTGEITDQKSDFSVQVCKKWEQTFEDQRTPFTRKVALRTAITLGPGGVIIPYLHLLKFKLGGRQGNGKQMYSWIHVDDLCRIVKFVFQRSKIEGVYNACSPRPVPNHQFMRTLRKLTGHRLGLPAFTWMLNIGARLLGTEPELVLKSRWVIPAKLTDAGFIFRYPDHEDALRAIIENIPRKKYHLFHAS